MKPIRDDLQFFRQVFAEEFEKALKRRATDQLSVARQLGVSRATVNSWINQRRTIDGFWLAKVMVMFEIQFDCFGGTLTGTQGNPLSPLGEPRQPHLFLATGDQTDTKTTAVRNRPSRESEASKRRPD
jgi:hypothetical protein